MKYVYLLSQTPIYLSKESKFATNLPIYNRAYNRMHFLFRASSWAL